MVNVILRIAIEIGPRSWKVMVAFTCGCLSCTALAGGSEPVPSASPVASAVAVVEELEPAEIMNPRGFVLFGDDAVKLGALSELPTLDGVEGPAYRVTTRGTPSAKWGVQLHAYNASAIRKGDVVFATFKARSGGSLVGDATTEFIFERASPDWEKSVAFSTTVGLAWTQIDIPFRAAADLGPGEGHASFRVGYAGQTIEIAEIRIVNLGPDHDLLSLPATSRTYEGMEDDAPWRAAAQARINQHRTADFNVRVVDAQGSPVPGASVSLDMTRSAFGFGSAVVAEMLVSDTPEAESYRGIVSEHFNEVVFENDMKWGFQGSRLANTDAAVDWLEAQGIAVRGHCLVWPSWGHVPETLKQLNDAGDHDAMREVIAERIAGAVGRYAGRLMDWDVMNEVFTNHDLVDVLGEPEMARWFEQAHAADPAAKLYINDYGILTGGGTDEAHQAAYEATIRGLIEHGAPIHGVGMQGHFGQTLTPPHTLLKVLDRYAAMGLGIKVTEFDISMDNESMQAAYARDFLTAMYSHPAVEAVVMWGFWERRHWRPNAAWWRADWSPRPAVAAMRTLLEDQWWTREQGSTDAQGRWSARGHLGEYRVRVTTPDGGALEHSATHRIAGTEVVVTLD